MSPQSSPDELINHNAAITYWTSVSPDVNGMLGGYPQVSRIDLRGSANFLAKIRRRIPSMPTTGKLKLAVDCGAGIGRIAEGFLTHACEVVDVVEPVENFARVVRESALKADGRIGDIYVTGLEDWVPPAEKKYDLIWNQWCLGHLTDKQLVEYLVRCKGALSERGLIVVKENTSTSMEDLFDELDNSVMRTDAKFKALFAEAELDLIKTEEQLGFSKSLGLYPVRFYALRP